MKKTQNFRIFMENFDNWVSFKIEKIFICKDKLVCYNKPTIVRKDT